MPAPARAREAPTKPVSLEERIRQRAYDLYVSRGSQSGFALDDWLHAEQEIQTGEEQFFDVARSYKSAWPFERDG
jgi:hypothetical protein